MVGNWFELADVQVIWAVELSNIYVCFLRATCVQVRIADIGKAKFRFTVYLLCYMRKLLAAVEQSRMHT